MDAKIKIFSGLLTIAVLFTFFFVACDKAKDKDTGASGGTTGVTAPSETNALTSETNDSTETEAPVTPGTITITLSPPTVSGTETETTETETDASDETTETETATATTSEPSSTSKSSTTNKTTTTTAKTEDTTMTTAPEPTSIIADDVDSFFNGGVFVGNSIMLGFSNFAKKMRSTAGTENYLGTSKFFCGGSFGVYNNKQPIKDDSTHPEYKGKKYTVQDAVGVMNAKTVYLNLMGLNDLGMYKDASTCYIDCANDMKALMEEIHSRYPDVNIVVISATYLTKERNYYPKLNNKNLSKLNQELLKYCNEKGYDFVDIATPLLDSNGCLAEKYCSDGYCHISRKGYDMWTTTLRNYAKAKMAGTYKNPSSIKTLSVNG